MYSDRLFGLWYAKTGASIALYLLSAAILCYAFFVGTACRNCPTIVGGVGVLYLFSGGLLLVAYVLPSDKSVWWQSILRLTVGTLSMLAALFLPASSSSSSPL